jgi:hypothetical protein
MSETDTNGDDTLVLNCRSDLNYYRHYWIEEVKKSLPNTVIFYGTLSGELC